MPLNVTQLTAFAVKSCAYIYIINRFNQIVSKYDILGDITNWANKLRQCILQSLND